MISTVDFFNSSQLLRYNTDNEYKTITGGIISLAIITIILISFSSMISDTMERNTIVYSESVFRSPDPSKIIMKISPENDFMMAVRLLNYNFSSANQIFEVRAQ